MKAISPNPEVDERCKYKKRTTKVIGSIAVMALKVTGEVDDEEDNNLQRKLGAKRFNFQKSKWVIQKNFKEAVESSQKGNVEY